MRTATTAAPANPYLDDFLAPVSVEMTATDLAVTGHIPEFLDGRYLRNGPNPVAEVDPATYHWFSGDGMVHGVALRDGKARWYRNRWVRSRRCARRLGEPTPAGLNPRAGMLSVGPNTNVLSPRRTNAGARRRRRRQLPAHRRPRHRGDLRLRRHPAPAATPPTRTAIRATGELHAVSYSFARGRTRAVLGDRHPGTGAPDRRHRGDRVADDARLLADRQIRGDLRPAGDVRPGAGAADNRAALAECCRPGW